MKTILFGIAMEGLSAKSAQEVELKTMSALKSGNREFADAVSVHCDYKEGLYKMCQQYQPDCIILNEALPGTGNIFSLAKDLKSDFPNTIFTILLRKHRPVGDVDLANLTASGIYNWCEAPWTPENIANSLISPKKMKDVEMYIPSFKEGSNGLAFETKIVEKAVEDKLEDLDIFSSGTNKTIKAENVDDIETKKEDKKGAYHKVIGSGFGFKKSFKPVLIKEEKTEEKPSEIINKAEEDFSPFEQQKEEKNEIIEAEKPETEEKESKTSSSEENQEERKLTLLEAIRQARAAATAQTEEEGEEKPVVQETAAKEPQKNEYDNSDFMLDDEPEEVKEQPKAEKEVTNIETNVEKIPAIIEKPEVEETSNKISEELAKKVEKLRDVEINPVKQEKKAEEPVQKKEKPTLTVTLSTIKFTPKFKKVLFIRALPVSSVVPAHVAKLMNAKFVDFNKHSNNDGYFDDLLRTTIKKAEMPDAEVIVGDVVAGNGIEKLVEKFDHVIAIIPEDVYEIKDFVSRYGGLFNGAVIDKAITSSITRKQLLSLIPGVKYIDTIKVDNCNKEVVQSAMNHEFLMDNAEFAEGMHYFLKDIGGVEWI